MSFRKHSIDVSRMTNFMDIWKLCGFRCCLANDDYGYYVPVRVAEWFNPLSFSILCYSRLVAQNIVEEGKIEWQIYVKWLQSDIIRKHTHTHAHWFNCVGFVYYCGFCIYFSVVLIHHAYARRNDFFSLYVSLGIQL